MKPYQFLLTTIASTSAIGVAGSVVIPSLADSRPQYSASSFSELPGSDQLLIAALPATTDRLWVKVRSAISIEELADRLAQDETKLAKLNEAMCTKLGDQNPGTLISASSSTALTQHSQGKWFRWTMRSLPRTTRRCA